MKFVTSLIFVCLLTMAGQAFAEVVLSTSVEKVAGAAVVDPDNGSSPLTGVYAGEVLRYTIAFSNEGTQPAVAGSIVITNPLPEGTEYVEGSAGGRNAEVTLSVDGENFSPADSLTVLGEGTERRAAASDVVSIRWTYQPSLDAGETSEVFFDLLML